MSLLLRRRALRNAFNPRDAFDVVADWDAAYAVVSGGTVSSVPDQSGHGNTLVPSSGATHPPYVAAWGLLGSKAAIFHPYDGATHYELQCATMPFGAASAITIVVIGQMTYESGAPRYRVLHDSNASPVGALYTYPGGGAVDNTIVSGAMYTGVNPISDSRGFCSILGLSGTTAIQQYFSLSSETPDLVQTGENAYMGTFYIGGFHTLNPAYSPNAHWSRALIIRGELAKNDRRSLLAWANSYYSVPIDTDVDGTLFDQKFNFNTNSNTYPSVAADSLLTPEGAIRWKFRMLGAQQSDPEGGVARPLARINPTVEPSTHVEVQRTVNGSLTVVAEGHTIASEIPLGWDDQREFEVFIAAGGGAPAEMAARNDITKPFTRLPCGNPTVAALGSLAGLTLGIGGETVGGTVRVMPGYVRRFTAYTDRTSPKNLPDVVYIPGSLVFAGNSQSTMVYSGAYPLWLLAALTKIYPYPYVQGVSGRTWPNLIAAGGEADARITGTHDLLICFEGVNSMINGETPAAAASDALTYGAARIAASSSRKVILMNMGITAGAGVTTAMVNVYNAALASGFVVGTHGHALVDISSDPDIGVGATAPGSNPFFQDSVHYNVRGGQRIASYLAPIVNGFLP